MWGGGGREEIDCCWKKQVMKGGDGSRAEETDVGERKE